MNGGSDTDSADSRASADNGCTSRVPDAAVIRPQMGRPPRRPWRVAVRCSAGFPQVIVSPSRLEDGTPFPNYAWLSCPWLAESCAAEESAGATAEWARRAASDSALAEALHAADTAVRVARAAESSGEDACATVGIAGQSDPLGVKCLHAHVALALVGVDDPIGCDVLARTGTMCPDARCERFAAGSTEEG